MRARTLSTEGPGAAEGPAHSGWSGRWGALLVLLAPVLSLATVLIGQRTLFFRDVANFHWPAKLAQARFWHEGVLPFVDLWRAGGQPGLGNLNTLALYPDNLLYLVGSSLGATLWAFNAHFWLHLLAAPLAFYFMVRRLGLGRDASWVGASVYASSGFIISLLSFYNLVAGATLVPLLVGATYSSTRPGNFRKRDLVLVSGVWSLLLLSGDPITALVGGAAALVALVAGSSRERPSPGSHAAGTGAGPWRARRLEPLILTALATLSGTLLAVPQLLEFVRTLEGSVRTTLGYSSTGILRGSWHPAHLLDALFPFALGAPNGLLWNQRFHGGAQPLFYSFAFGALALVLVVAALGGKRYRSVGRFGWVLTSMGLFLSLGGFNPIMRWLSQFAFASLMRFPVKFWWWVALGVGLLAALGMQRLLDDVEGRALRRARRASVAFIGLYAVVVIGFASGLLPPLYARVIAAGESAARAHEIVASTVPGHLLASCLSVLVLATFWVSCRHRNRLSHWLPALLILHGATQWLILRPLYPTLGSEEFLAPPAVFEVLDRELRQGSGRAEGTEDPRNFEPLLVHGSVGGGFDPLPAARSALEIGEDGQAGRGEDLTAQGIQRHALAAGFPSAGVTRGYRYQLNTSPEGIDSYLPGLISQVLGELDDAGRVRLLGALGVTHLVSEREVDAPGLVLLGSGTLAQPAPRVRVYSVAGAPGLYAVDQAVPTAGPREAVLAILSPGFDPKTMAVLPQSTRLAVAVPGAATLGGERSPVLVRVLAKGLHRIEVETTSERSAAVIFDRAYLPIYSAAIDGVEVPVTLANLVRLAVEVPAGTHVTVVSVDRGGFRRSWVWAGLGLLLLGVCLRWRGASVSDQEAG